MTVLPTTPCEKKMIVSVGCDPITNVPFTCLPLVGLVVDVVGNLSQDLSETELKQYFGQYGRVLEVRINTNTKQQTTLFLNKHIHN